MADGLAGFTQGLARGTTQLPDVVNQDRARQQQQVQFDTQVALQKEDQAFRKEQAALDEKHKAMADRLSLVNSALVEGPDGKLTFDNTSPQGQRLEALIRKEKADATTAEVGAGAAPEMTNLNLQEAKNRVVESGARAATAKQREQLGLRSLEAGVKGQELQNTKTGIELKNYFADRALDRFGKGVQIAATMAGTKATQQGMKIAAEQNDRANREANFQRFTAIFDRVSNEKHFDASLKADLEKFYGSAAQDEAKAVASFKQQYIENLAPAYGTVTDIPDDVLTQADDLAKKTAPKLRSAAGAFSSAIMDHPEATPMVAQMTSMLKDYTRAALGDGKVDANDAQRINDLVDVKMKELTILLDKAQSTAAPGNTGPVVGVNDGTNVGGGVPAPEKKLTLNPVPTTPGKNIDLGKKQTETRKFLDAALKQTPNKWTQEALNKAIGADTPEAAVKQLNRLNSGHWALGPNNEVVQMPWSDDLAKMLGGDVNPADLRPIIDDIAPKYAEKYAFLVEKGLGDVTVADDPASPATVLKVFKYFAPLRLAFGAQMHMVP